MVNNEKMPIDLIEPPPREKTVLTVAAIGGALAVIAGLAGLILPSDENEFSTGFRVILSSVAMIFAGAAISLRPLWAGSWFAGAAVFLLAGFGFPAIWDSILLLGFMCGGVALAGAVMILLPVKWRMIVASGAMIFHFAGIFDAITAPQPSPFLAGQLWYVAFRPYLQPIYIVNAYQFYSPDPGPASELWFCIQYENNFDDPVQISKLEQDSNGLPKKGPNGGLIYRPELNDNDEPVGEPIQDRYGEKLDANGKPIFDSPVDQFGNVIKKPITDYLGKPQYLPIASWLKIPRRPKDFKDPLGQSYYRRLSITENATHLEFGLLPYHQLELQQRRTLEKEIPITTYPADPVQFRWPSQNVQTFILPSYVRHIAQQYRRDDRKIAGIKVYRVQHQIVSPERFVDKFADNKWRTGEDPYSPTLYFPYYMGEFDVDGKLLAPNDPMLYWLVPIVPNTSYQGKELKDAPKNLREYHQLYTDYVEIHAGSPHMKDELRKEEK